MYQIIFMTLRFRFSEESRESRRLSEVSRIKLLHEYSPTVACEPVYFLFAKYGSIAGIFFWNRGR
jgi:hypothetical protein